MANHDARPPEKRAAVDRVHDLAANLAGAVLIVIALIVLAGIASRALFGRPIPSSNEFINSCLMIALIYLSLSAASHLRITVFTRRLPPKWAVPVERVVLGVCVAGLSVTAWAALTTAVMSARTEESTVGLYTFDIAPFRFLIFAGICLLLLRVVREGRAWLAEERPQTGEAIDEDSGRGGRDESPAGAGNAAKDT
ncbi:TRAP transporter small permease [Streptomyces albidus (ex Kaewkla and Franco 2022)]|uniref:TRAP transporter small permease n=1 Tax=Streptomyces albidus (ex Kaewkla and Franco 2022) TaxID=722709 RepID=UPI0015EFD94F|nr:TRAP transporter small permease [Streptomyces albidus (ex Kaewkla and Franco 2022)]